MKRFSIAVFFGLMIGCNRGTDVPDNVLPMVKMTNVLWDVLLADELVNQRYTTAIDSLRFDTSTVLYQQIARAHGTTQQQINSSLRFYQSRPDLLQTIFDSLQKRALVPAATAGRDSTSGSPADSLKKAKPFPVPLPLTPQ